LVVDVQAACGIDDEHVAAGEDGLTPGFFHQTFNRRRVSLADRSFVDVTLDRLCDNLQLLTGRGTVDVDRNQQGTMPARLEPVCQLARSRGLAGALKPGHQHDRGRLRGELHARRVLAKNLDQFVAHNLDDLLARGERGQHFLADRLSANLVDELLDHLEVDVGLEQREADFAQRLVNVLLGELGLPAEGLEGALEFFL